MPSNFSSQWLLQKGLNVEDLCMVEALGDGMAPTIPEGALLLVHTRQAAAVVDGTYLIRIGSRLLPKRIQPEWHGGLLLRCDNPAYEDEHLGPEETHGLQIFGQVVWLAHPLV